MDRRFEEARYTIKGLATGNIEPVVSLEQVSSETADPRDFTQQVIEEVDFKIDSDTLKARALSVLEELTMRERRVLRLRFGLDDGKGKTLKQTGEALGVSKSTAWRDEWSALRKLRGPNKDKTLQDNLQ